MECPPIMKSQINVSNQASSADLPLPYTNINPITCFFELTVVEGGGAGVQLLGYRH